MPDLDLFDRKLLTLVQKDADQTAETLAEQVGLSASAVSRRLKRLKADGVITATVALVDPAKVGKPTFFIAGLEIERERPEMLASLRRWLAAEDQVQEVFYVTGGTDFILVIAAPDVEAYEALMGRLMADNPTVRRYTTNVALGISKRGLSVPIPAVDTH
ncbi:MAG: Lrp/AsnC family transcriptional regulator [Niveispirillum sp.]|uniref:Lrp/AsnC family transcriptional regulator n=1 Tax=Alphaproteobacteria TaxID=28211 RepID=UPI002602858C|nr:Lrp/AsnC family transcriptional regulator [Asticcacaulis sp.]